MAVRRMLVAGRYRLDEPVGSGGMGRVWMSRDEMLDRDVAVKEFVPPDWMTDDEKDRLRERTLREARSAARLNHPNVVQIYDVVHAEGLPWIVMELVPSRSLHQVITEDGPFSPRQAARIGLHVLDALTAAHRAGVLHRDIKPHNVLIGHDGRVVLTDFGLATFVDDGSVTGPGLVVGSPQYVSPERARDGASTRESDLWSFGATLYAAVEGRSPYARESAMATLMALATDQPDPPVLAEELTPVLNGLLQREPADRLTADEVERRLRAVVAGTTVRPHPAGRAMVPSQRRGGESMATVGAPLRETVRPAVAPERAPEEPQSVPVSQISGPPAPPTRRRGVRKLVIGLTVLALLAGGGVAAMAMQRRDGGAGAGAAAPTMSLSADPTILANAAAGGFNPLACDRPSTAAARTTPQPGSAQFAGKGPLAGNFSYFLDETSQLAFGVPDGWTYERIGTTWCFRDTGNVRILSFDASRTATGDPLKACIAERNRMRTRGALPSYSQLSLMSNDVFDDTADWEYTYDADGVRKHAYTRWQSVGGKAYALGWVTRDFDWTSSLGNLNLVKVSVFVNKPKKKRS